MIKKVKLAVASIMLGVGLSTTAQADFVDFGDYLQDNTSGLQWMDVPGTKGRSWNDVNSHFGAGGDFEGWRFATRIELGALISNWTGIEPNLDLGMTELEDDLIDGLLQALGPTSQTPEGDEVSIAGFLFDAPSGSPERRYTAFLADDDSQVGRPDYVWLNGNEHADWRQSATGSFLVRPASPVPAPAALPLALLGLGMIAVAYRKRKQKI